MSDYECLHSPVCTSPAHRGDLCLACKARDEIDSLRTDLAAAQAKLVTVTSRTYCAYCGHAVEMDDDAASGISVHVQTCPKHPMRAVEADLAATRELLAEREADLAHECGERVKAEAEVERLTALLDEAAPWRCPDCGAHVKVDEHGCCATCGRDAIDTREPEPSPEVEEWPEEDDDE